jgi:hypothetical protein
VTVEAILIADLLRLGAPGKNYQGGTEEGQAGKSSHELDSVSRIPIQHRILRAPVE